MLLIETGGLLLAMDSDHSASRCISSCSRDIMSGLCEPVGSRRCWISWSSNGQCLKVLTSQLLRIIVNDLQIFEHPFAVVVRKLIGHVAK